MQAVLRKWLVAIGLLVIAYALFPDLWHGRLFGMRGYGNEWLPLPGAEITDPEEALGALIFMDYARKQVHAAPWGVSWDAGTPFPQPPAALLRAALGSDGSSPAARDLLVWGAIWGEPIPVPEQPLLPGDPSVETRLDRLLRDPEWRRSVPSQAEVESWLAAAEGLALEGIADHRHLVGRSVYRYLVGRGAHLDHAGTLASACQWIHSTTSPAVKLQQDAVNLQMWGRVNRGLTVGFPAPAVPKWPAALLTRLRQLSVKAAAAAALSPRTGLVMQDAALQHYQMVRLAWVGGGVVMGWCIFGAWVLVAWICLRRRTGADEEAGRQRPLVLFALLTLPALAAFLAATRSPRLTELAFTITVLAIVAIDAHTRGARGSGDRRDRARDVLFGCMLMVAAGGGSIFWVRIVEVHQRDVGAITRQAAILAATIVTVGIAGTLLLWGRERAQIESWMTRLLAAVVVITLAVVTVNGLTRAEASAELLRDPLGGLVWIAAFGVLYWGCRQARFGGQALRPETVSSVTLIIVAAVVTGSCMFSIRFATLDPYLAPAMILTMLVMVLPLADGALRRSSRTDAERDPAVARGTAAWCAALSTGLLVLAVVAICAAIAGRALDAHHHASMATMRWR